MQSTALKRSVLALLVVAIALLLTQRSSVFNQQLSGWGFVAALVFLGMAILVERAYRIAQANTQLQAEIRERQRSEVTLRSYFELPLIGIAINAPDKTWIEVNDKLCEILGYSQAELKQVSWVDLTHPEDLAADLTQFERVLSGEIDGYLVDKRFIRKDGQIIHTSVSVRCMRHADGTPDYFVAVLQDISERVRLEAEHKQAELEQRQYIREQAARVVAEAAEKRWAFLAEVSAVLASSLDYETTLSSVAHLAVPMLGDYCLIYGLEDSGSIRRLAISHIEPEKEALLREIDQRYPLTLNSGNPAARVMRTGQSEISGEIPDSFWQKITDNCEHLDLARRVGAQSYLIVPLLVRGQVTGALSLVSVDPQRRYGLEELALAEELARRAAIAVDHAQLYREAQQARQRAEHTAARMTQLQAITAALSEALTPNQVAEVVVNQGMTALGAAAGAIALLHPGQQYLEIAQATGYPRQWVKEWQRCPLSAAFPFAETVRLSQPIFFTSWAETIAHYPDLAEVTPPRARYQASVCLPLIVQGQTLGSLGFSFAAAGAFSPGEQTFMRTLAHQCAQAIARAQLYAAEQQARAEAEAANRTKDEFLAILSHELRTPLNAILGWSRLLRTRGFDPSTTERALETIERNAKAQANLIEDILDVSRIIQGKLRLKLQPTDLAPVIRAALDAVGPAAEAKEIDLSTHFPATTTLVLVDGERIQQVVWNLISNAVKFTPKGGQVSVEVAIAPGSPLHFSSSTAAAGPVSGSVQIQVTDTGKGIDREFLPYVFDRFRQGDSTSTRLQGGLGLGLAIARHLVELHGGTIHADSLGENQGATFTVKLPLILPHREPTRPRGHSPEPSPPEASWCLDDASATDPPPSPAIAPLKGLQVLVVDDEPDTLSFVATVLEPYGASVTLAASADEALSLWPHLQPDILVSDIAMPEKDGYALIQKVRDLEAGQPQIPALALTAYASEEDRRRSLLAGFQMHVAKPVEPNILAGAIANLSGRTPPPELD